MLTFDINSTFDLNLSKVIPRQKQRISMSCRDDKPGSIWNRLLATLKLPRYLTIENLIILISIESRDVLINDFHLVNVTWRNKPKCETTLIIRW